MKAPITLRTKGRLKLFGMKIHFLLAGCEFFPECEQRCGHARTVSTPLRSKAPLLACFEWTTAHTGTPFARSSSTTAPPVLPVAAITGISGYLIGNLLTDFEFQLLLHRPTANQAT